MQYFNREKYISLQITKWKDSEDICDHIEAETIRTGEKMHLWCELVSPQVFLSPLRMR